MNRKAVRAVDHLPSEEPTMPSGTAPELGPKARDAVLLGLFGAVPDYSRPELDRLWQEINASDPQQVYEECARAGVDVLDDKGVPVPFWRDIAVMLRAGRVPA